MSVQFFNRRDLDFLLYELLDVEQLTRFDRYKEHSRDTFNGTISAAEKIATDYFYPHHMKSDENEPELGCYLPTDGTFSATHGSN